MSAITEKIRKVLAVAESSNQNEAMTALLKARELMARYKLTESDCQEESGEKKMRMVIYKKDHFTEATNGWFVRLARIIADNYCCVEMIRNPPTGKALYISFLGIGDDPVVASDVFGYAVQHIKRESKKYKKKIGSLILEDEFGNRSHLETKLITKKTKTWESSYVSGFIQGLSKQYEQQFTVGEEAMLALALIPDAKVSEMRVKLDAMADRTIREVTTDRSALMKGYKDGCSFEFSRTILPNGNLNAENNSEQENVPCST